MANNQQIPSNGEFTFSLKEKIDRNGKTYLFGAIQLLNCVIFVRPTGQSGTDGFPRWYAQVKPYTGQQTTHNPDEDAWEEDLSEQPNSRRPR